VNAPIEGIALAIVIVGLALSTFVTRTSFLVAGARGRLHPRIETALRYAPVCTLIAIIVPDVLMHAQHADFSLLNPRLAGVEVGVGLGLGDAIWCGFGVAAAGGLLLGCDFATAGGGDALGGALSAIAFITRGDSAGLMVSLITSFADFWKVTGMFRCTSKFTVAISRWASSE